MIKTLIYIFIILLFNNILHANNIKDFIYIKSHNVIYNLRIDKVLPSSEIHNAIGNTKKAKRQIVITRYIKTPSRLTAAILVPFNIPNHLNHTATQKQEEELPEWTLRLLRPRYPEKTNPTGYKNAM